MGLFKSKKWQMNNHLNHKLYLHVVIIIILCYGEISAQVVSINNVLDSIEASNPVGRMYDADIRSMNEAAKGARSWMPPEIAAGFFMAPYNTKRWKKMSDMEPGMGSFMISAQQMIPNRKKLIADQGYMQSMSGEAIERRKAALNDLFAQAKKAYYEWVIIERKKLILAENEKVLDFMIKNAEIRYKNGLDKINAYYKAKAALGNIQSMLVMLENDSRQRKIILNTLMNRSTEFDFGIDTTIRLSDFDNIILDSSFFLQSRSDLRALNREVLTNQLRAHSERLNLKPQFGIRFEHMFAFGDQPQQFTLMGMMRLPMVPWASRMTKANIESYTWRIEALRSQQQMIINEARGMAIAMRAELETKKRQIGLFENAIIPALRNNYKTMLLAYEQNTEELFMLFDAWETLNMTQIEYLDRLQELLTIQVELEKILEIRN